MTLKNWMQKNSDELFTEIEKELETDGHLQMCACTWCGSHVPATVAYEGMSEIHRVCRDCWQLVDDYERALEEDDS